jgi:hypothetical protein
VRTPTDSVTRWRLRFWILGDSPEIVRKHYAKWTAARQARIDTLFLQITYMGKSIRKTLKTVEKIWWTAWDSETRTHGGSTT